MHYYNLLGLIYMYNVMIIFLIIYLKSILYYLFRMDSYSEGDRLRDNSMEWSNSCDFNCGTSLYCTVFCFWLRNIQWNKLWFSGTWLYISLCNKYKFFMSFSFKREKERKVILSLHFTFIVMFLNYLLVKNLLTTLSVDQFPGL